MQKYILDTSVTSQTCRGRLSLTFSFTPTKFTSILKCERKLTQLHGEHASSPQNGSHFQTGTRQWRGKFHIMYKKLITTEKVDYNW